MPANRSQRILQPALHDLTDLLKLGYAEDSIGELRNDRTSEEIRQEGGVLEAIRSMHAEALDQGLTRNQVVQLVNTSAEPPVAKLRRALDQLGPLHSDLGYQVDQVVTICSQGVESSVHAARNYFPWLRQYNFNHRQTTEMISNPWFEEDDLDCLLLNHEMLEASGYTPEEMKDIVAAGDVRGRVAMLFGNTPRLEALGFGHDLIRPLATVDFIDTLPVVVQLHASLVRAGMTNQQICIALHDGADVGVIGAIACSAETFAGTRTSLDADERVDGTVILDLISQADPVYCVRDRALQIENRFPALNRVGEYLDVIRDQLPEDESLLESARLSIRPGRIEELMGDPSWQPYLLQLLESEERIFCHAVGTLGLSSEHGQHLYRIAKNRLEQEVAGSGGRETPHDGEYDHWNDLLAQAVNSDPEGHVIGADFAGRVERTRSLKRLAPLTWLENVTGLRLPQGESPADT